MKKIYKLSGLIGLLSMPLGSFACHVAGKVWYDLNRNGRMDDSEEKISGVTVKVWKDANNDGIPDLSTPSYTTTTNSSGYYYIDMIETRYIVEVVLPAGYSGFTTKASSGVSTNRSSKVNSDGKTNSMWIYIEEQVHAGLLKNIEIGDKVWFDANRDGRQDADEPGIDGVVVKLFLDENEDNIADDATPIASETTDVDGNYLFTQISPRKYFVQFETPSGYTGLTIQDASGIPIGENSTANVSSGKTGTHNFTSNYYFKDAGYLKNLQLSGNIFLDNNALKDLTVNGSLISSPSGEQLYANLFNGATLVASQAIVSGAYLFENIAGNTTYNVVLSTIEGAGSANIPSNWVYTGENIGVDAGNDGNADGSIEVTVSLNSIYHVNFGLQPTPTPSHFVFPRQVNPGDTASVVVDKISFTGLDEEGGIINELRITEFPTNIDRLLINDDEYEAATFPIEGITLATNDEGHPNDAIRVDPIDGDVTASISYKVIDEAGFESNDIGTVQLPFITTPLFVNWLYFNVTIKNKIVQIDWATTLEENCKEYIIERSIDGQSNWETINTVASKANMGNSTTTLEYNSQDNSPLQSSNYYRIKQVDIDGKYSYTEVKLAIYSNSDDISNFPNPVKSDLNIKGLKSGNIISIYNVAGQKVLEYTAKGDLETLNLGSLNTGNYFLQVSENNKVLYNSKITKD